MAFEVVFEVKILTEHNLSEFEHSCPKSDWPHTDEINNMTWESGGFTVHQKTVQVRIWLDWIPANCRIQSTIFRLHGETNTRLDMMMDNALQLGQWPTTFSL